MVAPAYFAQPTTTRERLIAAAFRVVARDGLEAASVKVIAAEADITPGLLHYHFPGKAALLEAVLREALANYLEASARRREASPPERQLADYFKTSRASLEAERDFFKVRLAFAAAALTNPSLAEVLRDLNDASARETALTLAAARGETDPTPRDVEIGRLLKAAIDGIMLSWLADPAFPIDAAADDIEKAVRAWIA
ncbi:TetR/AcrR family transcriptional regulator [Caulobacter mirabilis]|nr:TetR family transcriptional regulator [Caulobacter mirabilis]